MNIIDIIILSVLGVGTQTGRATTSYTLEQANLIYYRLIRFVLILIGLMLISWTFNIFFDFRSINILFALAFAITAMIISTKPRRLAIIAGAGAVLSSFEREQKDISEGMKKFLKAYMDIVFNILAWGSLIFIVLFITPLNNRPWVIFWATLAIVVFYKIVCQAWNFPGTLAKKIIYRVTQGVIVYCVIVLIPSFIYLKTVGFDLGAALVSSQADKASAEASKSLYDAEEGAVIEKINNLTQKIKDGKASEEERDELKKIIQKRSLLGRIFSEASAVLEKIPSAIEKVSWKKSENSSVQGNRLIDTVNTDGSRFPRKFVAQLPSGKYEFKFQPSEAADGAMIQILLPNKKYNLRGIGYNPVFIEKGELGNGIVTNVPSIASVYVN